MQSLVFSILRFCHVFSGKSVVFPVLSLDLLSQILIQSMKIPATKSLSSSMDDITSYSAKVAVLSAFPKNCTQHLAVRTHSIPLAKKLGVKFCSKGKKELLMPLAKQLFKQAYLTCKSTSLKSVNFKHLKRSD